MISSLVININVSVDPDKSFYSFYLVKPQEKNFYEHDDM